MNLSDTEYNSIETLCERFKEYNSIDPSYYKKYDIKRGLRNADGTGVVAGLTKICNVHGYVLNEHEREPIDGKLIYRGIDIEDLIAGFTKGGRYGFEETIYLLLFGVLPNKVELEDFTAILSFYRELPEGFAEDMIFKAPSRNIMNKMARSVLALYSYDDNAEDNSLVAEMNKAIKLIARIPTIMVNAYQVKRRHYDHESMYFHPSNLEEGFAQSILSSLRMDRAYTEEEARLLDLCLVLHAEHGGGNNSTFTCRSLTSTGTDAYSAYAGAISALKGPRHGGANIKVAEMLECFKNNIQNVHDEAEIASFIEKVIDREAGDGSGLIYGMGHAVYTKSDPRAVILKQRAESMAAGTEFEDDLCLLETIEKLTPAIFERKKGASKVISANVDMYSGLVYRMLGIPSDLFTPLFAVSRMAGWAAHRMEELMNGNRIVRPAYKAIVQKQNYVELESR
ncbi:MAG: citrate synthase [Clostridiales bacterium]|nr:MAG: citrate synthase [Clostridiales bacterium]